MKKLLSVLLSVSLVVANPVFAASFGKSGSSSSSSSRSSSSSSSPSRSSSSYSPPSRSSNSSSSYSSPSRSSSYSSNSSDNRQSAGMSRSTVTESVRNGSYKNNTTPSYNNNNSGNTYASPSYNNNNSGGTYSSPSYNNNNRNNNNYNNGYGNNGNNNYGGNYQAQAPRSNGYGTGALIGAAAVGALAGYLLHKDSSGNTYYTNPNNPNVAYDSKGNQMSSVPQGDYKQQGTIDVNGNVSPNANSAGGNSFNNFNNPPNRVQSNASSSGLGFLGWLIVLGLILGAVVWFLNRRKPNNSINPVTGLKNNMNSNNFNNPVNNSSGFSFGSQDPKTQLEDEADKLFMDIQTHNRPSQIGFIQDRVDPMFFESIRDNVMSESDDKVVIVKSIESEVVDFSTKGSKQIASVHYRATLEERNGSQVERQKMNDVWHFTYQNGKWLWAGLEEVEPQENEVVSQYNKSHYNY